MRQGMSMGSMIPEFVLLTESIRELILERQNFLLVLQSKAGARHVIGIKLRASVVRNRVFSLPYPWFLGGGVRRCA
jgi:hypothetical protein